MARKTVFVCDNCEREQDESKAEYWLDVHVDGVISDTSLKESITFCSYGCMSEWAAKKEANLSPA